MVKKKKEIKFIKYTKDEWLQFVEKVENDEIKKTKLKSIFDYFMKKKKWLFRKRSYWAIKNVVVIEHHVNLNKIDFFAYSGRLLLTIAIFKTVIINRKFKFQKYYALCLSKFNERHTDFKDNILKEIIIEIDSRFECLVNEWRSR